MVVDDVDTTIHCSTDADFFCDWFEGRCDIDSNLCVIDEDISFSLASDAMSLDEVCM